MQVLKPGGPGRTMVNTDFELSQNCHGRHMRPIRVVTYPFTSHQSIAYFHIEVMDLTDNIIRFVNVAFHGLQVVVEAVRCYRERVAEMKVPSTLRWRCKLRPSYR